MCRKIDNMNDIVYNLLEIGKIHFSMSNFDMAASFLVEAQSMIKNINYLYS